MVNETVISQIESSNKRNISIEKTENKYFAILFTFFLNSLLIVDLSRMLVTNSTIISVIRYALYGSLAICSFIILLLNFRCKTQKRIIIFIIVSLFVFIISYIATQQIKVFFWEFSLQYIIRYVPALILISFVNCQNIDLVFKNIKKFRFVWIVYGIVGFYYISRHTEAWGQYSSNYGFNLLIPTCFSFYQIFQKNKIKWSLYSVFFLSMITLRGSRTTLLCSFVFFLIFYMFKDGKRINRRWFLRLFFLTSLLVVGFVLWDSMIGLLAKTFPSSRTISLLSSNINFDSGRGEIQDIFKTEIYEHPFIFRGILADRIFYSSIQSIAYDFTSYPHNFFIEVIYQFGFIFGGLLLLWLVYATIKTMVLLLQYNEKNLFSLYLVLFVCSIVRLCFSSSYLTTYEFYLFVGMTLSTNMVKKGGFTL